MAFGRFEFMLALGMLITGSVNTLSTNWADKTDSKGTTHIATIWAYLGKAADDNVDDPNHVTTFNHPFFQAGCMFLGESLCLAVFLYNKWSGKFAKQVEAMPENERPKPFNRAIFILPACCDMTGTSLMYAGLCLSSASVFQMMRGSVVIFTGILSVIFLKRKLFLFHWIAIALVSAGVLIIGVASLLSADDSAGGNVLVGDILIVFAQFIVAIQMVVEEKFVYGYNVPALQAVGLEGCAGVSILSLFMIGMYYVRFDDGGDVKLEGGADPPATGYYPIENVPDALSQLAHSAVICIAMGGNIFSIAFFNFFGISVTKAMSASHRMVLDSIRTIVVWGFSLAVGWETLNEHTWIQLLGFIVLLYGTLVYNEVAKLPFITYPPQNQTSTADTTSSINLNPEAEMREPLMDKEQVV